ncbi:MAG: undecaprenyl/decaprenyl-phosphate alpha-N-acetylglucosaminyl 1-phosphate transferase [Oscillospiraceae bacterium]|nr:undecaprenyl/decaprenyl-phosphate alpha-N-acetylglucosaminyl 1-phosphate transferase [Oscillospiraceae bacterium]
MLLSSVIIKKITLAIVTAFIVSFCITPIVKSFAKQVGAVDIPDNKRHIHKSPTPRMGGLAIFLGFIVAVLLLAKVTSQIRGILLGSVLIVVVGAIDDVLNLNAWLKFGVQILAAVIAVLSGVLINVVSNPLLITSEQALTIGVLSVPVTVIWIVAVTNSVNLIDGLDGLACGVSTIACISMLVVSMLVSEANGNIAVVLAALCGACLGFLPYNLNPAKIFMGDTGALLLGYVLATVSVIGMFKFYAIITFILPVLALAVPLMDTIFAFTRRMLRGQSPFHADRGHFHHKLLDIGLSQKQAVAVLYAVSAILGLASVLLTTSGLLRTVVALIAFVIAVSIWLFIFRNNKNIHLHHEHNLTEEENNEEA